MCIGFGVWGVCGVVFVCGIWQCAMLCVHVQCVVYAVCYIVCAMCGMYCVSMYSVVCMSLWHVYGACCVPIWWVWYNPCAVYCMLCAHVWRVCVCAVWRAWCGSVLCVVYVHAQCDTFCVSTWHMLHVRVHCLVCTRTVYGVCAYLW